MRPNIFKINAISVNRSWPYPLWIWILQIVWFYACQCLRQQSSQDPKSKSKKGATGSCQWFAADFIDGRQGSLGKVVPQLWDPLAVSFPYHSHILRDSFWGSLKIPQKLGESGSPMVKAWRCLLDSQVVYRAPRCTTSWCVAGMQWRETMTWTWSESLPWWFRLHWICENYFIDMWYRSIYILVTIRNVWH